MLKPSTDRMDYTRLLSPPPGYDTALAVGATYSLDLDALIGVSLALGLSESIDGELFDSPVCLLNALMRTADKVAVFCQGGQISVPVNTGVLHTLLDKMVFEVNLNNKKSFHPKLWFVRYQNSAGEARYRVLVLSRNLTFDRSWDTAFCLEGSIAEKEQAVNAPLKDFLRYLKNSLKLGDANATAKKAMLEAAIREVMNVQFTLADKPFTGFEFYPTGIYGEKKGNRHGMETSGLFERQDELVVLSPFLSSPGGNADGNPMELLSSAGRDGGRRTLITRRSELGKLSSAVASRFDVYVMRDEIIDGEEVLGEGAGGEGSLRRQDIHAKLYLRTKGADSALFVGSQNASNSAFFGGNVEFMLKLMGKRRYLNVELLKKDLFGESEKENPFVQVTDFPVYTEEAEGKSKLERVIKDICLAGGAAKVMPEEGLYGISLSFDRLPHDVCGEITPLLWGKAAALETSTEFHGLPLSHLCEFYKLTVRKGEDELTRIIRLKTTGIPQERDSAIVNSILKNKQGFITYVSLILGDNYYLSLLEARKLTGAGYLFTKGEMIPALYEKMLRAAAASPEKLNDIGRLLELISDEGIIPQGFQKLYNTFQKAVHQK